MAFAANEKFASANQGSFPGICPEVVRPKEFAAGVITLPVGCPVTRSTVTKKWAVWDSDGASGTSVILGIVYPDPIVLDAAASVIGQVMEQGTVDYAAIRDAIATTFGGLELETEADLKTNLQGDPGPSDRSIFVQNLASVK